jgi:hypothetical protein
VSDPCRVDPVYRRRAPASAHQPVRKLLRYTPHCRPSATTVRHARK